MKPSTFVRIALLLAAGGAAAAELPQFVVPGQEPRMKLLDDLFALHHGRAFTQTTLWDAWLPQSVLWAAEGQPPTAQRMRDAYRGSFLRRRIGPDGYVAMQQHRGMAHSDGWPFPAWQQSTGAGWHFSTQHEDWAVHNFRLKPLESAEGWEIRGAAVDGIDPARGLRLRATGDVVTVTTPAFRCGTIVAPFARIEWAAQGLPAESRPGIEWRLDGEPDWPPGRRASFPPLRDADGLQYANVPMYRQPGYAGLLTRYRLVFDRAAGARIDLKSLITAIDTRHPITNPIYLRGCADYFAWTGDADFLRADMGRLRRALRYALDEFSVRREKHVLVPWVGHDGRSGLVVAPDGRKTVRPGLGVGNNYWDLLPFGGHDALATIYLFDALNRLAELERAAAAHPEWAVPRDGEPFDPADLAALAAGVRGDFVRRFWNAQTGRFVGWIDLEGRAYDYGFTFVNLEAIAYGLATPEQAQSILAWLDGRREVAGDTSRGADIYRWRFAPRATTRRNVETYMWPWHGPETIPWGDQVQDGGAVLGFSHFDLMARLATLGPDDAWRRLREILDWFGEVQAEGGYRAYYAKPGRGKLQGGGPPGGLGLDCEFLESVLVPQVMLYGFLGLRPGADGATVAPRLPGDWPSLTVTRIHLRDHVFDLTAHRDGRVEARVLHPGKAALRLRRPDGTTAVELPAAAGEVRPQ